MLEEERAGETCRGTDWFGEAGEILRPLVTVFGELCCSNNPQMLGAYKNKCLPLTYITCLLRTAVREL